MFREGRRSADHLFTVLYRESGRPEPRLGMTVSARRIRGAVERNRLRRLVRESFRHTVHELPGLDIVVVMKESAKAASNREVFASLAAHWARLKRPRESALPNG